MQAAVGCAQLMKLPQLTRLRREHHATLSRLLAPLSDLLHVQEPTPGSEPSWFGLLLTLTDTAKAAGLSRDAIVAHLEAAKIQTRMLFAGNMVRQPCFDAMRAAADGFRVAGELTATDRIMNDAFWVGVYPGLSDEMLEYVGRTIAEAVGGRR
jgi:CDP-6-deoxy-D-xylo-4-hexulose-3-dehydrase